MNGIARLTSTAIALAVGLLLAGVGALAWAMREFSLVGLFSYSGRVLNELLAGTAYSLVGYAALSATCVTLILKAVERIALGGAHVDPQPLDTAQSQSIGDQVQAVKKRVQAYLERERPDVISAFNELMCGASRLTASDVHMSPDGNCLSITYRVHGTLYTVVTLDPALGSRLSTRVKVLAQLDTFARDSPQDGRLVLPVNPGSIEARVSTMPTEAGDRIVLRLVRGAATVPGLDDLGFSRQVLVQLRHLLAQPQGLVFVTGPVGSGKTTTLYSCLKHISLSRGRTTSLVTLEDPIEMRLPFAAQSQIRPKHGMTFASGLRSALRQDPNVLMVGEIRDGETAEIGMQAGLTGHLILTTVHGHSAAGPFARLLDMHVQPFALASATVGSLAQRLVRTLCTHCRKASAPQPMVVEYFNKSQLPLDEARYFEPSGCEFCEGQGFTGRTPIAELLVVNAAIERAIYDRRPTAELTSIAIESGMVPLLADGLAKAARGETALSEVIRVAG